MSKTMYLRLEPHMISPESGANVQVKLDDEGIVVNAWSGDGFIASTWETYNELGIEVKEVEVMSDYDLIQFLRDKVAKRGKNEKMYRQLLEMATGDESEPPEPELKPCTMCGSTKLVSVLYCHHCSSESGWFEDKQQAIDTCNRTGQEAVE
jgi:hypothetical protein